MGGGEDAGYRRGIIYDSLGQLISIYIGNTCGISKLSIKRHALLLVSKSRHLLETRQMLLVVLYTNILNRHQ